MIDDKELDDIIKDLKTDKPIESTNNSVSTTPTINDDNINQFIIDKMSTLVKNGMDTIESLQQTVITGFEPEELVALSTLIQSVIKAADTLNKINIESKKSKTAKELKLLDVETKKELGKSRGGNTNILVATREEIISKFLTAAKEQAEKEIIEAPEEDYSKPEEPK
jgi:hypothetical protein